MGKGRRDKIMIIGKTGPVPKKKRQEIDKRGSSYTEHQIQCQCEELLNIMGIAFIRIPDAVYRQFGYSSHSVSSGIKKQVNTYLKGLPDITILCKSGKYYAVELKSTKGKQSQGQKNFEKLVTASNYYIIRSVEALQELIEEKGIR